MGSCCEGPTCETPKPNPDSRPACPRCTVVGRPVGAATVEAILKPGVASPLRASETRFCRTPGCDVLYYGGDGRFVEKDTARVRVGLKETDDPVPLCYCFEFARADVRRELAETGNCTIPDRITAEVRAGRCACEVKNPSGACCLGDVNKAVKEAKEAIRSNSLRAPSWRS